jgi:hypothetical protein
MDSQKLQSASVVGYERQLTVPYWSFCESINIKSPFIKPKILAQSTEFNILQTQKRGLTKEAAPF